MEHQTDTLISGIMACNQQSVARAISVIADRREGWQELLTAVYRTGRTATLIGITGAPGSGKSTFADSLITFYRQTGHRVGVIAVDPSSPFSGGAILGDRLRMQRHSTDPDVFIRSMASRGKLGGLAPAAAEAAAVLSLAGYDIVILETVGVGQSEVDVMTVADVVLMILVPGNGDSIQTMKAGVMEIGDLFIVNQSDRPGADRLKAEVEASLVMAGKMDHTSGHGIHHIAGHQTCQTPELPVFSTIATEGKGTEEVIAGIDRFLNHLNSDPAALSERKNRQFGRLVNLVMRDMIDASFHKFVQQNQGNQLTGQTFADAVKMADDFMKWLRAGERKL
jgi:LAO/AO transport system kinase